MAIGTVQGIGKFKTGNASSILGTFSSLPTAGNLLVAYVWAWAASGSGAHWPAGTNVRDNKSNSWTQAVQAPVSNGDTRAAIYYLENVPASTGSFIVTVNSALSNCAITANVIEYSGAATASSFDVAGSVVGTNTTPIFGTVTPSVTGELAAIVETGGPGGTQTITTPTGFSSKVQEVDNANFQAGDGADQILANANQFAGTWTLNASGGWNAAVATFKPAAGIAFDAASNSTYQTAQSTYSWNHTCTGSNRELIVTISMLSVAGSSVTGITYNSVAMVFLGAKASVSGAVRIEMWGLVNPSSGLNSIAVTLSTGLDSIGGAISYTGVHQTSPTEGFNSASATNVDAADATVTITTVADNDWVVAGVASDDTAITAGQTSRNNVTGALGSGADEDNNAAKTPAGGVTMTYTNIAALATWSIAGIALRPIAAASLGGLPSFKPLSGVGT